MPSNPPRPVASVLVPTTTQATRLQECLAALAAQLPAELPLEVVVVASAPTPEVAQVLAAATDPRLTVVECGVNLGVAGGFDRARAAARGKLLCLLHDDTVIAEGWLEAMLAAADEWPESGVFASVVTNPGGSLQSAGFLLWADAVPGDAWPPGTDPASLCEPVPVDFGSSCALAVRPELFDAIGGLEERFHPGYYVDVDCAMSCREAGRVVRLVPAARVVHHRRSSSSGLYRDFLAERNRGRFLEKWAHRLVGRPALDASPAGIAAARTRARAEAEALVVSGASARPLVPRFRLDPREQEARLLRDEQETLAAYRHDLEARLAETTAGIRWLEAKALELAQAAGLPVERDAGGWPRFDLLVAGLAARLRGAATAAGAAEAAVAAAVEIAESRSAGEAREQGVDEARDPASA